jgi:hypothetical protein
MYVYVCVRVCVRVCMCVRVCVCVCWAGSDVQSKSEIDVCIYLIKTQNLLFKR